MASITHKLFYVMLFYFLKLGADEGVEAIRIVNKHASRGNFDAFFVYLQKFTKSSKN